MKFVSSMTGFAGAQRATALGQMNVELRSVNSRFLDLSLKMPDEFRVAEAAIREAIAEHISRGKLELRVAIERTPVQTDSQLNAGALSQVAELAQQISRAMPGVAPLGVADVLNWPGVVDTPGADFDTLRAQLLSALAEALDALTASRQREGAALRHVLLSHCDQIDRIALQLASRAPELISAVERKLIERLQQSLASPLSATTLSKEEVSDRIRQEVTLYALKIDVDEEIKRLTTHTAEVRRVLANGGAVGRRLDFLMQELNREANTLGSKAAAIEMTNTSVDLKILIEQMREQIQNLE